ncbi:hypothetical protein [Actinoalloteichus fjordicus]|uniref:Uncharacterized protein n=1 Tax=Actinoalloteichus fjordicus TaxID=1612552 RepID=A0AAC9LFC4_9PSEU|nr:hypothetical protein [Actinoalloteichus fjordicus]APU15194.1 hypothetical protein UA74_15710 [Actinoalloteichus fjordicus]
MTAAHAEEVWPGEEPRLLRAVADERSVVWAGMFRRLRHTWDGSYRSVGVAVCGAVVVRITTELITLNDCPACFPSAVGT